MFFLAGCLGSLLAGFGVWGLGLFGKGGRWGGIGLDTMEEEYRNKYRTRYNKERIRPYKTKHEFQGNSKRT